MLAPLFDRLRPETVAPDRWRAIFDELCARYREPHRRYHDLEHLTEMTGLLVREEARLADPFAVMMAAFFHDAVLAAGARDNEQRSAVLARALLGPLLPAPTTARIAALILATRGHDHDDADHDRTLLIDADLAILAAPPARFRAYELGVRAEYGYLADDIFAAGRRHFLAGLLARPIIFGDAALRAELEPAARANLAAAFAGAPS